MVDAAAELSAAKTAEADTKSPYEYTAAESYLHKAREDHSYANFETAERFARKARDCAQLARARAELATRTDIGASASALPVGLRCRGGVAAAAAEKSKTPQVIEVKPAKQPKANVPPVKAKAPRAAEDPLPPGDDE